MMRHNKQAPTAKRSPHSPALTRVEFLRKFCLLIFLAWTLPPVFGLSFLLYIEMFTVTQMAAVLGSLPQPGFDVLSLIFAVWYFHRSVLPVADYVGVENISQRDVLADAALTQVRTFPQRFWSVFLVYLIIAPATIIYSAEWYSDFVAQPVDWIRISLVALTVSIIVGLPIFLKIYDLFGRALRPMRLKKPILTIRTRVFLLAALVPLLVETMLVQYYWARTGYFTLETFIVWLALQGLAVAGALTFLRSLGQSLHPLESAVAGDALTLSHRPDLRAESTDELGVLAGRYQSLLEQLYFHNRALEVGNHLLSASGTVVSEGKALEQLVDICREALSVDIASLLLHDKADHELVGVVHSGVNFDAEGHFRVSLDETSLATLVFNHGPTSIDDTCRDSRVSPRMVNHFGLRSALATPLEVGNKALGVLIAATQQRVRHFDAQDFALIELLAHEIATVVNTQRILEQRRQAESRLHEAREMARVTLQSISDGVVTTDIYGRVTYLNPVAEQLTGWVAKDAQGRPLSEVLHLLEESSNKPAQDPVAHCLAVTSSVTLPGPMLLLDREGGREFAVEVRVSPIREADDQVRGVVLVFHDTSELAVLTHRLTYQATHDALTGLVNRHEFEARLDLALSGSRHDGVENALCFLDLDRFKVINDTCGHVAGDELLKQLGARLRATTRESDTVGRLGGDEFGVLLEGCQLQQALEVAENLLKMVRNFRFAWGDKVFNVGLSIGLVPVSADSGSITDVLSAADSACYVAKDLGRDRVHVFEKDDLTLARHKGEMQRLQEIRRALELDHFVLYEQPLRRLTSDNDEAHRYCEILLRLQCEQGPLIAPGAFLPAAERYHLMPEIDRWVVRHALRYLDDLIRGRNGPAEKVSFAINLSAQSLCDEGFRDFVLNELEHSGAPPEAVCFEITETAAIANLTHAMRFISALKQRGCRFALDDFGSGLSSFSYLKNLPVDYLKIDGAFIKDMDSNAVDRAMVAAINEIGHLMGMKTVAEFVATEAVLLECQKLGVDFVQGHHIGHPKKLEHATCAPESVAKTGGPDVVG